LVWPPLLFQILEPPKEGGRKGGLLLWEGILARNFPIVEEGRKGNYFQKILPYFFKGRLVKKEVNSFPFKRGFLTRAN